MSIKKPCKEVNECVYFAADIFSTNRWKNSPLQWKRSTGGKCVIRTDQIPTISRLDHIHVTALRGTDMYQDTPV